MTARRSGQAVCEHELEGVVAKRLSARYLPGERGWIKTKNCDYWRWEMEREGALQVLRVRQFVEARGRVGRFVLGLISQSSRQRSELIAMPLVNRQPLKLFDGKPARLQPLCELLLRGERQPQGRRDRRLCVDPNLDLGLAVRAGDGYRGSSH
jgi:hypothetical protein